jgi:hypothetical protein
MAWWWMQGYLILRRLTVTNSWGERDLMPTLWAWRAHAQAQGFTRLAELCDPQADELGHVLYYPRSPSDKPSIATS